MIRFDKVPINTFINDVKECGLLVPEVSNNTEFLCNAMYELAYPERATKGSAGYDIRTPFAFTLKPGHSLVVPTGIRCIMPEGFVLMLFPRSGLGFKYGICLENTTGIIDSDFINSESYGHILVKLHNPSDKIVYFNRNDKICQGIITKYFVTDDDNATAERLGGFGSTGQ